VSENRALRRISGPQRDVIIGDWRNMHNEEFHNLYSSPNRIRIIKLRRKILAGMQHTCERRGMHSVLMGNT
jgi:hypothetical protein